MYYELLELACLMMGKDYNSFTENQIEEMFFDEYGIVGMDQFEKIIKDLIPFTPTFESPLTESIYQGFVVPEEEGIMRAIIKREIE